MGRVRLDPRRPYKPLDLGNGIVSGSLTAGGRWLSLGCAHPVHGRVVLTDEVAFPDARRNDQSAVRAYRSALASPGRLGFGLEFLRGPARAYLVEDSFPLAVHVLRDARVEVLSFAPPGRRGAVQVVRVEATRATRVEPIWTGIMRLARAAYTQLTPGEALPAVVEQPTLGRDGRLLWIADDGLGAAAAIALGPTIELARRESRTVAVAIALGDTPEAALADAVALAGEAHELAPTVVRDRRALWAGIGAESARGAPVRRAVSYAFDCAASRVDSGAVAILADHEILPLVWTRDAYYVCRALLAIDPRDRGGDLARAFVRWCFEVAERPGGWWPRASLASGQAKDRAFQLDQQLYPLLLLDDIARLAGDHPFARRYAPERDRIVAALLARRAVFGLIATDESPADDPLDRPFHFSSHVLLWRVLRDIDAGAADEVREATLAHFTADGRFAYAVRGPRADGAMAYHDANDLPTVFAPGWGFCAADDARWRATIAFAWSSANRGWIAGDFGGLGSVHTLHPWPLGDLQDLVVARVIGDRGRAARARSRLRRVSTWDGMLPEAYDEADGSVASRHWFAWPLALWALLEHDPGRRAP